MTRQIEPDEQPAREMERTDPERALVRVDVEREIRRVRPSSSVAA